MQTKQYPNLPLSPRAQSITLAMAVGLSVVVYVVGTRPATPPQVRTAPSVSSVHNSFPAQTYKQLRLRKYGPNAKIRSNLERMRVTPPSPSASFRRTEQQLDQALDSRSHLRAYDGAPPVIPHPIDQQDPSSCLACHGEGLVVEGRTAHKIPHPRYASCTQCHVTSKPQVFEGKPIANSFVGQPPRAHGTRQWATSPPTIPHSVWMRRDCNSCHGPAGPKGLRTPHPERRNCVQCHAEAANLSPPWAKR